MSHNYILQSLKLYYVACLDFQQKPSSDIKMFIVRALTLWDLSSQPYNTVCVLNADPNFSVTDSFTRKPINFRRMFILLN